MTDSTLTLTQLYGTGSISELSSLQEYSRLTGVAYTDIVSILETTFVNPGSWLLNLVEALDLTYATLESVNAGTMTAAALGGALPPNLVYTDYGKGVYIYTGLSFFRELPAGVPGAYRLFINLLSQTHHQNQPKGTSD